MEEQIKFTKDSVLDLIPTAIDLVPAAIALIEVIPGAKDDDAPRDYIIRYANDEFAALLKASRLSLTNCSLDAMPRKVKEHWLKSFRNTAFTGAPLTFEECLENSKRYIRAYTFQIAHGLCGCLLRDISTEKLIEEKVMKLPHRMATLLSNERVMFLTSTSTTA